MLLLQCTNNTVRPAVQKEFLVNDSAAERNGRIWSLDKTNISVSSVT